MIIKTDQGQFIKVDCDEGLYAITASYIWGYRWNRNEQRWGRYCIRFSFKSYAEVDESELPKKLEVD